MFVIRKSRESAGAGAISVSHLGVQDNSKIKYRPMDKVKSMINLIMIEEKIR